MAKLTAHGYELLEPGRYVLEVVEAGTKAWDIFEACLNTRLSPDEELDTDDLVGKRFHAMVSVKKTGKGNRTEHGTIGPYRPKKDEPKSEEPGADEDDFGGPPF